MELEFKFRHCQGITPSSTEDILRAHELSKIHLTQLDVPFSPIRVPR